MFAILRRWSIRLVFVAAGLGAGIAARLGTLPSLGSTRTEVRRAPVLTASEAASNPAKLATSEVDVAALARLEGTELLVAVVPWLPAADAPALEEFAAQWAPLQRAEEGVSRSRSAACLDIAAWELIVGRWAEVDGPGMMLSVIALARPDARGGLNQWANLSLLAWAGQDPDAARTWTRQNAPGIYPDLARLYPSGQDLNERVAAGEWISQEEVLAAAAKDLPAAVRAVEAGLGRDTRPAAALAGWWAKEDPAAALAWARSLPESVRADVVNAALASAGDPDLLREELAAASPGTWERQRLARNAAAALATEDFPAAEALVKENFFGTRRDMELCSLLAKRMVTDPAGAVEGFRALGWPDAYSTVQALAAIGKKNPAAAFAELSHSHWDSLGREMSDLLSDWVKQDPQAAMAWAANAPETLRPDAAAKVRDGLRDQSGPQLVDLAQDLPPGRLREEVWSLALPKIAAGDPAQAITLAAGLDPDSQAAALLSIFKSAQQAEGQNQALTALAQVAQGPGFSDQLNSALQQAPPEKAAALLGGLPSGVAVDSGYTLLAKRWSQTSPQAASSWVSGLPAGVQRDSAISGMIDGISADGQHPEAWVWAGSITNNETRSAALQQAAAAWLKVDPDTARAVISEDASLPDNLKAALLK